MSRATVIILLAVLLALGAGVYAINDADRDNPLRLGLGDDDFAACGLDKLAPEELDRLLLLMRPSAGRSYLAEGAMRFMEANGWRRIDVLGIRRDESSAFPKDRLVIADGYDVVVLDHWGSDENLPAPGTYWGQNSLSSWKLIYADGRVHDLRAVN